MKKTIVTVFAVIIVLVVMGIVTNIVTNGAFFYNIANAVSEPINDAWKGVTGGDTNLINPEDILSGAGIENGEGQDLSIFDN